MNEVIGIAIWAHSKCRSTFDLYREVMRQSRVPVRLAFWKGVLDQRVAQGFSVKVFDEVDSVFIGDDWGEAEKLMTETVGWTHIIAGYQVATIYQRVMRKVKLRGDRVIVYSEAPCEMCIGFMALLKRLYYRYVLPVKLRPVVKNVDLLLSQSGVMGIERLMRLGWRRDRIVPFGYACSPLTDKGKVRREIRDVPYMLRVLHLGVEDPYRGTRILEQAVRLARKWGAQIELRKTGGRLPPNELLEAIRTSDLVVGCGICEPWGIRINDAVMEGVPVIVSEGMGVSYMVAQEGCGFVVPSGDAQTLSRVLIRCASDRNLLNRLRLYAIKAAERWSPASRAKELLRYV